jgi:hypothetical protein
MSENVSFTAQVKVDGGPTMPISLSLTPGAYDKLSATVPAAVKAAAGVAAVHVQPVAGLAQLLIITSSSYVDMADTPDLSKKLTAGFGQVDSGGDFTLIGSAFNLDGPLVISGKGALASIATGWTMLQFSNNFSGDVTVNILVCRDL